MQGSRRHLGVLGGLATAMALVGGGLPSSAAADLPVGIALTVEDGASQPAFDISQAVTQRVWVETEVDTDSDGKLDRVVVDVDRPPALDGGRAKFASILTASPYFECCGDAPFHNVNLPELPQEDLFGADQPAQVTTGEVSPAIRARAELAQATAEAVRQRFLARGYAIVNAQTIGTADSDGCPTIGDRNEVLSVKAVIQWLNGSRIAYDEDGDPVEATWSTGDVGMIGVSYNGTLPQMVATTGVKGLRTIVPISAISSWYDYYRANGLVVSPGGYQGEDADVLARFVVSDDQLTSCSDEIDQLDKDQDRVTGDYSRFWRARDYVRRADGIRASVFAVHGLDDWNVKMQHVGQFWDELTRLGVPRKIWLHQFGHGGPPGDTTYQLPDGRTSDFDDTVDRWMEHWLYDVDNGIMDEPRAIVQREDAEYRTYGDWPAPAAEDVRLRLAAPDATDPGTLSTDPSGPRPEQGFVDTGRTRTAESLAVNAGIADGNRLVYVTAPLDGSRRMSGAPSVNLRMSVDNRGDANVTALLLDYSPDGTAHIVTRGWIDPQNRNSAKTSEEVVEDKLYALRFGLQPDDHVFSAGHRIGLVVISTDYEYTIRPDPGAKLTLSTRRSALIVPLTGSAD